MLFFIHKQLLKLQTKNLKKALTKVYVRLLFWHLYDILLI